VGRGFVSCRVGWVLFAKPSLRIILLAVRLVQLVSGLGAIAPVCPALFPPCACARARPRVWRGVSRPCRLDRRDAKTFAFSMRLAHKKKMGFEICGTHQEVVARRDHSDVEF
jgi:hypothetical protein